MVSCRKCNTSISITQARDFNELCPDCALKHYRSRFILKWYLFSSISLLFLPLLTNLIIWQNYSAVQTWIPIMTIWPLFLVVLFLGGVESLLFSETDLFLTILILIEVPFVPVIGYMITYIISCKRIPRSIDDLLLPFNKDFYRKNVSS
ncbi:MAG: hypothetical protein ACFE8U_07065 [Candidatus Hermodarchaeota archaeon]